MHVYTHAHTYAHTHGYTHRLGDERAASGALSGGRSSTEQDSATGRFAMPHRSRSIASGRTASKGAHAHTPARPHAHTHAYVTHCHAASRSPPTATRRRAHAHAACRCRVSTVPPSKRHTKGTMGLVSLTRRDSTPFGRGMGIGEAQDLPVRQAHEGVPVGRSVSASPTACLPFTGNSAGTG